jgi:hypothetical protein
MTNQTSEKPPENKANSLGWDRGIRAHATGDGPLPGAANEPNLARLGRGRGPSG